MIKSITTLYHQFKSKRFYARLIKKNDLCFDIGANIGSKSKLFLSNGAKVIAFEPQSACIEILSKIKNPNFSFYSFAVGSANEVRELHLSNHSEVATLSDKFIEAYHSDHVYWNTQEKVTVKTLDHLISEFGLPDYCKIDVEGYELEILSQLSHKIPMIEFEFTEKFISDTLEIIDHLSVYDYRYNYILNEQPLFQLNDWVDAAEIKRRISALPKKKLHGNLFCKLQ